MGDKQWQWNGTAKLSNRLKEGDPNGLVDAAAPVHIKGYKLTPYAAQNNCDPSLEIHTSMSRSLCV